MIENENQKMLQCVVCGKVWFANDKFSGAVCSKKCQKTSDRMNDTLVKLIRINYESSKRIAELESLIDIQETEARIGLINVEYERTRMAQLVALKDRIAELEARLPTEGK